MIIAVINQKGGVGKSTSAVNIGVAMAQGGARVLLLDLDTQRDLLSYTGLGEGITVAQADHNSLASLVEGVLEGSSRGGHQHALLDCPPALNEESAAALKVAHLALVPLQAEYAALRGLARLTDTLEVARARYNPGLRLKILLTMFDGRARHCAEVEAQVRKRFGAQVLEPVVRRSIAFAEASLAHQSILQFAPRSAGARTYRAVAQELQEPTEAPVLPRPSSLPGKQRGAKPEVKPRLAKEKAS